MLQQGTRARMGSWGLTFGVSAIALAAVGSSAGWADDGGTQTPIKHVIVLIGENRSFDNVFATYKAKYGQSVGNLLSRGIVKADGSPGPNSGEAKQFQVDTPLPMTYFMGSGFTKMAYSPFLPTPDLGGAPNQPISPADLAADPTGVQPPFDKQFSNAQLASLEPSFEKSDLFLLRTGATGAADTSGPDTRVANYAALPNTVFPLTGKTLPYDLLHRGYGAPPVPYVAAVGLQCGERDAGQPVGLPQRPLSLCRHFTR